MLSRETTISAMQARMTAISVGNYLKKRLADRQSISGEGDSHVSFARAVCTGNYEQCLTLLEACVDMEARAALVNVSVPASMSQELAGRSALIGAIMLEYPSIVRLLLSHGADPAIEVNGDSPLTYAVRTNRPFITRLVVEAYVTEAFFSRNLFLSTRRLECHFVNTDERRVVRRHFTDIVASMSLEEFVCGIPHEFRKDPGQLLLDLVELAASTRRKSMRLRSTEPLVADDVFTASARAQLVAAGCLRAIGDIKDALGRRMTDELLRSPHGERALRLAVRFDCHTLLSQPEVQKMITCEWYGALISGALGWDAKIEGREQDFGYRCQCLGFLIASAVGCILLLPLISLFPFINDAIFQRLTANRIEVAKQRVSCKRAIIKRRGSAQISEGGGLSPVCQTSTSCQPSAPFKDGVLPSLGCVDKDDRNDAALERTPSMQSSPSKKIWQGSFKVLKERANLPKMASVKIVLPRAPRIRPELTMADAWLFRVPAFKFACRQASNVAMAAAITTADSSVLGKGDHLLTIMNGRFAHTRTIVLILWALGACISEYLQIAPSRERLREEIMSFFHVDLPSRYRTPFNVCDFLAVHLMLIALLLPESASMEASVLWSMACCTSWLRLLRLLLLSPKLGPLTLIFVRMVNDLVQLLVIQALVAGSFGAALYVLFRSHGASSDVESIALLVTEASNAHDSCNTLLTQHAGFTYRSVQGLFFAFLNGAIEGNSYDACLMREHPMWGVTWLYAWLFKLITAVLLINMLIAMMTRTCDTIYEASAIHSQFLFVQLVFVQFDRSPEPPPFNLLRILVIAIERFVTLIKSLLTGASLERSCLSLEQVLGFLRSGLYHNHSLSNGQAADSLDSSGRYVGSNIDGHNSWETWKSAKSEGELRDFLEDFVARHADDVAQEERWRTKMMKRIARQFDSTDRKIEKQSKLLNAVLAARGNGSMAPAVTPAVKQKSRPSRIRTRNSKECLMEADDVGGGTDATDATDARLAFSRHSRNARTHEFMNARSAPLELYQA